MRWNVSNKHATNGLWILISIIGIISLDGSEGMPENNPLFFNLTGVFERGSESELISTFSGKDKTLAHALHLIKDKNKNPLFYYANIQTPVCIDNICKPVYIEMYWNLLGAYIGYGVFREKLLTKYDHDLFEQADYQALHRLLLDRHSILERRDLKDLFDPNTKLEKEIEYRGQKVDGISGATKREIRESVVAGGLFSCFTLWHLANGDVTKKISDQINQIMTPELERDFLHSGNLDYQYFAIKNISSEKMATEFAAISDFLLRANAMRRTYVLKKFPAGTWVDEQQTQSLYESFSLLDVNSKTLLIEKLGEAHEGAFLILASQVKSMTKNHLKDYLRTLREYNNSIKPEILETLKGQLSDNTYGYNYLVEDFLRKIEN